MNGSHDPVFPPTQSGEGDIRVEVASSTRYVRATAGLDWQTPQQAQQAYLSQGVATALLSWAPLGRRPDVALLRQSLMQK
jgi:hypothetical protein